MDNATPKVVQSMLLYVSLLHLAYLQIVVINGSVCSCWWIKVGYFDVILELSKVIRTISEGGAITFVDGAKDGCEVFKYFFAKFWACLFKVCASVGASPE